MTEEKDTINLNSVYTTNLPNILEQLQASIIVSTYQSGKIILLRNDNKQINTHFKSFNRPMGLAVKPDRIALGAYREILKFYNIQALTSKLDTPEKYDACYITRTIQETGAIDIHEISWGNNEELFFINTRFSCLCKYDTEYSFKPIWRPSFISGLGPEDRCHLNGLGMKDGNPKYVTALGETDDPNGWRNNKRDGGLLIDIEKNEVLAGILSMPHSPRWYDNKIWFLESGYGSLAYIDPRSKEKRTVAKLPGFTRGLDFAGPIAFIGLSQVRESAVFEDFPLLEELEERICGVYLVDIRNGQIIGFVRFEGDVEEIFAVQILNNKFPELLEPNDELNDTYYVSPSIANLYGYRQRVFTKNPRFWFEKCLHTDNRDIVLEKLKEVKKDISVNFDYKIITSSKKIKEIKGTASFCRYLNKVYIAVFERKIKNDKYLSTNIFD